MSNVKTYLRAFRGHFSVHYIFGRNNSIEFQLSPQIWFVLPTLSYKWSNDDSWITFRWLMFDWLCLKITFGWSIYTDEYRNHQLNRFKNKSHL